MKDDISQEIRGGTTFSVYTNVTSCLSAKKKKKKSKMILSHKNTPKGD